ncbi:MAG: CocE/NonD family hydrolase [Candidatus Hodarchaeota archaeon]
MRNSQPVFKVKVEKNVYVEMRDGVRVTVDIYRPDAEGKFPALFSTSGYPKEINFEAGDTEYIVSKGYAHVIGSSRGTGRSEGDYTFHSHYEGEDGHDVVEWIAKQPWCSGNVGMIGYSYFAVTQLLTAAEQPPHLKAIVPFDDGHDLYREQYEGGILLSHFYGVGQRISYSGSRIPATLRRLPEEEVERLVEEKLKDPDLKAFSNWAFVLTNPKMNPPFFDYLLNPLDGPFYWERSVYTKLDRIKIPVYCGGAWRGDTAHLSAAFIMYLGLRGPKKLLLYPREIGRHSRFMMDLTLRWHDFWLKGIDNGIMDEPPIRIFVMESNRWRYENEWPLARTKWTKFYLRTFSRLSKETETFNDVQPDCFGQSPASVTKEIRSLTYSTAPLPEDLEVTGPIALYLYASIDQDDTNWMAYLKDVGLDGSKTELTRGFLKASHRALDKEKSKLWQPYHTHTQAIPIVPGEIYEYAIEIIPTSNLFKAGHRIELEIKSTDFVQGARSYHLPSSRTTLHKIYRDKKYPSHLLLPVIPNT